MTGTHEIDSGAYGPAMYRYEMTAFEPQVEVGQSLEPGDVIGVRARATLPHVVDVATPLRKAGKSIFRSSPIRRGDSFSQGQRLAATSGFLGFGRREVRSPVSGLVTGILEDRGLVIIRPHPKRETILALFPGVVRAVDADGVDVEIHGVAIPGVAGVGVEVAGNMGIIDPSDDLSKVLGSLTGTGDVAPPRVVVFQQAIDARVAQLVRQAYRDPAPLAVITPSASYREFTKMHKEQPATTFMIVSGFGSSSFGSEDADPLWRQLRANRGKPAIVIPHAPGGGALLILSGPAVPNDIEKRGSQLGAGSRVRFFKDLALLDGTISEVLEEPCLLPSGYRAPSARVRLEDGSVVLAPLEGLEVVKPLAHVPSSS